jgi:hypothetical protein
VAAGSEYSDQEEITASRWHFFLAKILIFCRSPPRAIRGWLRAPLPIGAGLR